MPNIVEPVEISGYTQNGATRNTVRRGTNARLRVVLSGAKLTSGQDPGLRIHAPDCLVEGLVVNRFRGPQIELGSGADSTWIRGSFFGVNATGRAAAGAEEVSNDGIDVESSDNMIGGLARAHRNLISANGGDGVELDSGGTGSVVRGNLIGTNATGRRGLGNAQSGVYVVGNDLLIGGATRAARNVISGNRGDGVLAESTGGPEGIDVQGNYIGTNAAGTAALPNRGDGVQLAPGADVGIGGVVFRSVPGRAPGNVISGNRGHGIHVPDAPSIVGIDGNLVGTNASGTAAVGNRLNGLAVFAGTNSTLTGTSGPNVFSGNRRAGVLFSGTTNNAVLYNSRIGTNRAGTKAVPNRIGVEVRGSGSHSVGDAEIGNVVSGNRGAGIWIHGQTSAIVMLDNLLGLGADGVRPIPNRRGIVVSGEASPSYIGYPGEPGNVIAGNLGAGIALERGPGGTRPDGTVIASNRIGVTASGRARPNGGHGILIDGAVGSRVGDTGSGNRIAHNRGAGVLVASGTGNSVVGNSIYGNRGLGIDLAPAGMTPNDPDDPDGGANNRQNYPVLTDATFAGGVTTIEGRLNSVPSATFFVEFFKTAAPRARVAEARTSLGLLIAITNAAGVATFSFEAMGRVSNAWLRATATRTLTRDTSELGPALRAP